MGCFTCGTDWAIWGVGDRKFCFTHKPLSATLPKPRPPLVPVIHRNVPVSDNGSRPAFRNSDPITSRLAAPQGRHLNDRQKIVLAVFEKASPSDLTNEQVIDALGEEQVGNISSRVTELRDRQYIRLSGAHRKSRQGKPQQCHVWVG
jgi:hypothetical protein